MTNYFNVPLVATGDWIDAAWINQYIGDNLRAVYVYNTAGDLAYASAPSALTRLGIGAANTLLRSTGSAPAWATLATMLQAAAMVSGQASGDLIYSNGASTIARLAKPSVNALLKNTSAGVPSWMAQDSIPGLLHSIGYASFGDIGQTTTDTAINTNVTNATLNITTTRTCTIVMVAHALLAIGANGHQARIRGSIGGVVDSTVNNYGTTGSTAYVDAPYIFRRTGVGAGNIACLLKFGSSNSSITAFIERGGILTMAFVE